MMGVKRAGLKKERLAKKTQAWGEEFSGAWHQLDEQLSAFFRAALGLLFAD